MITTAVQQASQMVEVQGAPPAGKHDGEDFSVAFTVNVNSRAPQGTAQSSGSQGKGASTALVFSSAKQAASGASITKSASTASRGATQSVIEMGEAAVDVAGASSSRSSGGQDILAADAVTTADRLGEASASSSNSRSVALAFSSGNAPIFNLRTVPAMIATKGNDSSAHARTEDGVDESADGAAVKGSRNGATTIGKSQSSEMSQGIVPGLSIAGAGSPSAVAQPTLLNGSNPVEFATASDVEGAAAGVKRLTSGWSSKDGAGNGSVALGEDGFRWQDAEGSTLATSPGKVSDEGVGFTEKTSESIDVVNPRSLGRHASLIAGNFAVDGPLTLGAPGSVGGRAPELSPRGSASARNKIEVQGNGPSAAASGAVLPQGAGMKVARFGPALEPSNASRGFTSNAVRSIQELHATTEGRGPAKASEPVSVTEPAQVQATAPVAGVNIPPEAKQSQEVALASGPLREPSSKTEGLEPKDGRVKVVDGAEETTSNASGSLPPVGGLLDSASNASVAVAGIAAGKVATAGNVAAPVVQITPQMAGSAAGAGSRDTAPAGAIRIQESRSTGPFAESSSGLTPGESHRTLLATPTTLEVGVQSGTQGWLRIRAEVNDQGAVNASLAAASSGGRDLLHSQMPALNAFLHSEQVAVTTTVVERGAFAGAGQGGTVGSSGGPNSQDGSGSSGSFLQGGGAQSDDAQRDLPTQTASLSASETGRGYEALTGGGVADGMPSVRASVSEGSGRWLNVRV